MDMTMFFVELGITAVLRILQSRKDIKKFARALAKIDAEIHRVAALEPELANAIEARATK